MAKGSADRASCRQQHQMGAHAPLAANSSAAGRHLSPADGHHMESWVSFSPCVASSTARIYHDAAAEPPRHRRIEGRAVLRLRDQ